MWKYTQTGGHFFFGGSVFIPTVLVKLEMGFGEEGDKVDVANLIRLNTIRVSHTNS